VPDDDSGTVSVVACIVDCGIAYHYLVVAAAAAEADDNRDDRSVAMCTVQSPSSSVSASLIVADISDWSPEQLLRLNAATAAIFVVADRISSTAHALETTPLFSNRLCFNRHHTHGLRTYPFPILLATARTQLQHEKTRR